MRFLLVLSIFVIFFSCKRKEATSADSTATTPSSTTEQVAAETTPATLAQEQTSTTATTTADDEAAKPTDYAAKGDRWVFGDSNNGDFYSGEFAYMADAAIYFNCASGKKYPVLMRDDFKNLEKQYLRVMGNDAGQRALAVFEGYPKQIQSDGKSRMGLVVTKTVSVSKEVGCSSYIHRVGGMYSEKSGKPTFTVCTTNQVYGVATNNLATELSNTYSSLGVDNIYVEFVGAPQSTEDNEGNYYVITRLIGADKTSTCK